MLAHVRLPFSLYAAIDTWPLLQFYPCLPHNTSMAKKKRKPKTPDPASFAFGVMQLILETIGVKPDEPKLPQDPLSV